MKAELTFDYDNYIIIKVPHDNNCGTWIHEGYILIGTKMCTAVPRLKKGGQERDLLTISYSYNIYIKEFANTLPSTDYVT